MWTRRIPRDVVVVLAVVGLVAAAALVGRQLIHNGVPLFLDFPPLFASWRPHLGPGTPIALLTAVLVAAYGPRIARQLAWPALLWLSWTVAIVWTLALALIDGWRIGVAGRLSTNQEYLWDLPKVSDIGLMLRTFSDHILTDQPVFWTTHVGAHPPGAFLLFVWLDRIGLSGGGWAGIVVILIGSSASTAVATTLRGLGAESLARTSLPFLVLFPGAVWVGVSADGLFAGILAWAIALLAVGTTKTGIGADLAALTGGLLLGYTVYLSYGLVLGVPLALLVMGITRDWRAATLGITGAATIAAAFTAAGFWWFTGYQHLTTIYAASVAQDRPYAYFVWANLAAFTCAVGPAVIAGLRRFTMHPGTPSAITQSGQPGVSLGRCAPTAQTTLPVAATHTERRASVAVFARPQFVHTVTAREWIMPAAALIAAALAAVALADLTGLSKAEVERIWLPFAIWLVPACAWLPRQHHRRWLAAQGLLALAVNSLLLTAW